MRITAVTVGYNKIGRGTASKVTSIMTRGSRPIAPSKTHFLAVHSNYVIFHLRTWSSSGCELTHFSISYRRPPENWFLVFDHLKPQNEFILKELSPGEEYVVKITAHNSAGSTSQEYVFITPTDHAGWVLKIKRNNPRIRIFLLHSTFHFRSWCPRLICRRRRGWRKCVSRRYSGCGSRGHFYFLCYLSCAWNLFLHT